MNYKWTIFPLVIYLVWATLSLVSLLSLSTYEFELSKIAGQLFLFIALLYLAQDEIDFKKYSQRSVIIFLLISLFIGIYQWIDGRKIIELTSIFGNKNLFASILFLGLPFLWSTIRNDNNFFKIIGAFTTVLSLFTIILLQTRSVWLGILIMVIGVLFLLLSKKLKLTIKQIILGLVLSFGVFIFLSSMFFSSLYEIKANEKKYGDLPVEIVKPVDVGSFETRYRLNEITLDLIKDYPLMGVGIGNWKIFMPKYGLETLKWDAQQGVINYQRTHNDWLQPISELGIIGGLFYITFFVSVVFLGLRLIIQDRYNIDRIILLASLLGYFVIMFVDFPSERTEHNVLMLLIITFLIVNKMEDNKTINLPISIPFIAIIVAVGASYFSYQQMMGEKLIRKVEKYQKMSNWDKMIISSRKALNYNYDINPYSVPTKWYEGVALFSKGNIKEALNSFLEAEKIHPYNVNVLNNIASSYYKVGNVVEAEKYYKKVLEISPNYEEALINLSVIYYNSGQVTKAYEAITECYVGTKHPNYHKVISAVLNAYIDQFAKNNNDNVKDSVYDLHDKEIDIEKLYMKALENGKFFDDYLKEEYLL